MSASLMTELSASFASAVEKAGRSVLRMEGRDETTTTATVWSADGVLVMAAHVIEPDEQMSVALPAGGSVKAELVGSDPTTDVAVVRADTKGLDTPQWGDADALQVGHLALSLGRPGRNVRARLGIVAAAGDAWRTPGGGQLHRYIETDANGFSGGPLVDGEGRVLGMNTGGILRGVTLTVPYPTLQRVVEQILQHGRVRRGYLGIGAHPVQLPAEVQQKAGVSTGLLVVHVEPNSPAATAGIFMGDTLLGFEGKTLRHMGDLLSFTAPDRVGQAVDVKVLRAGAVQDVKITIGTRP